jgi:2-oxoglutarate ferredoxin oxidoreductase subunit gamma
MNDNVFMAGYGGQGILLIGNLLAYGAILENNNATYFPAYGPEKRGGAATCTVIVSDSEIGSPVIGHPCSALLFNQLAMDKYFDRIAPGGLCIYNASLVEKVPEHRPEVRLLAVPANELAAEVGNARLVNMIILGAYAYLSKVVSLDSLKEGLEYILPERNRRFIPANIEALDRGAEFARKVQQATGKQGGF